MQSHQVGEHRAKTRPAPESLAPAPLLFPGRGGLVFSSSCVPRVKDLEGTGGGDRESAQSRASVEVWTGSQAPGQSWMKGG